MFRRFSCTLVLVVISGAPSFAQTNSTWDSSTGNWTDGVRWSTNPVFPHNGQPNAGDTYIAIINGGEVTLNQNIILQGLTYTGGNLIGASNLTLNAASSWSGGTMGGNGITTFNGSLALTGTVGLIRTVNTLGTTTWTPTGLLLTQNSAVWNNQSGALFNAVGDGSTNSSAATFNNQVGAVFRKSAGAGTTAFGWIFNNAGAAEVNTGTLSFTGGGTSPGTFQIASGATLSISNNPFTFAAGSTLNGAGNFSVGNGFHTLNGAYNVTGPFTLADGTLDFNSNATLTSLTQTGNANLSGAGNLTISGASSWTGGSLSGAGTKTFNAPLAVSGGLNLAATVNMSSTTTWTGNVQFNGQTGGVWNNLSGSLFDAQGDAPLAGITGGTFNNQAGAILRKSAGAGVTTIGWTLNNSGTVQANAGTLSLSGSGTGTGTFQIAASTALRVENFNYTFAAGSIINGPGDFVVGTGEHTINGAFNASGGFFITEGTLNFNSNASVVTLQISGATARLQGAGNVTAAGASSWTGGDMLGAGTTTINGPFTLGNAANLSRTLNTSGVTTWSTNNILNGQANGNWINQNGAVFDAQGNGTLDQITGGTFKNLSGATFRKSAGGGVTTVEWAFTNNGVVQGNNGVLAFTGAFTQASAASLFANGGTIRFGNGAGTVNLQGIVGGQGTVDVGTLILSNGQFNPGASPGTLTIDGNLTLDSTISLNYELGTLSDLAIVNGDLTFDGTLNVVALSGFGPGTFPLIDFSGALTDNGLLFGTLPDGFDYQIFIDNANGIVNLQVTAVGVPEPSGLLLSTVFLLGSGLFVRHHRQRLQKSRLFRHSTV